MKELNGVLWKGLADECDCSEEYQTPSRQYSRKVNKILDNKFYDKYSGYMYYFRTT